MQPIESRPAEPWPVLTDEQWEHKIRDFLVTTYSPDEETLEEMKALSPEDRYIQLTLMHGFAASRSVSARANEEPSQ